MHIAFLMMSEAMAAPSALAMISIHKQKLQKANAHKVCLVCRKVANNKEKDCPNEI